MAVPAGARVATSMPVVMSTRTLQGKQGVLAACLRLPGSAAYSVRSYTMPSGLQERRLRPATSTRTLRNGLRAKSVESEATGEPSQDQAERSNMVFEQLILFIFQMETDTQLQRALNMDAFDAAKQIRLQREQVDEAVAKLEESKKGRSGTATASNTDVRDTVSEGLLLRSELQRAIEAEDYAEAARLRDQLAELEQGASKLASSLEMAREDMPQQMYALGQRFVHAQKGYQGVIVGWDMTCCEDDEWRERAQVSRLARRENQPFYHVLVDEEKSNWGQTSDGRPPVAYVAEEYIKVPKDQTWLEAHGPDVIRHPFEYLLFFGKDGEGNMIPVKALRENYNQPRKDVYAPGEEEKASIEESEDDDQGLGDPSGDDKPDDDKPTQ